MKELGHTKTSIANQLRARIAGASLQSALAAIEGLGELGGVEAIKYIEDLMSVYVEDTTRDGAVVWAALLRAYGRAGRFLQE